MRFVTICFALIYLIMTIITINKTPAIFSPLRRQGTQGVAPLAHRAGAPGATCCAPGATCQNYTFQDFACGAK